MIAWLGLVVLCGCTRPSPAACLRLGELSLPPGAVVELAIEGDEALVTYSSNKVPVGSARFSIAAKECEASAAALRTRANAWSAQR